MAGHKHLILLPPKSLSKNLIPLQCFYSLAIVCINTNLGGLFRGSFCGGGGG